MTNIVRAFGPRERTDGCPARRPNAELVMDHVYVLFTSIEETLGAVRVASRLAKALGSRLTILHFRPVAFGAPLEAPAGVSPAETEEFKRRLEAESCDAEIKVCLCRDARGALPVVLHAPSLIVMGRHRRWPSMPDRWRRTLEAAGHFVVSVDGDVNARRAVPGRR